MIINTYELTDQFNKSGRNNQSGKPALEAVSLAWRLNQAKKLTLTNRKVNHSGSIETNCPILQLNLIDIWRNYAYASRLKPERYTHGQRGLADNNAIPYPQKTIQAGLDG